MYFLPHIAILFSAAFFFTFERIYPGRELPNSKGWYLRAILITISQILITFLTNKICNEWYRDYSLFNLSNLQNPLLEGFIGWLTGSFFFYWWHRIRHRNGFWHVFHQIHHSPKRIEAITSFYKHPIEILSDSLLSVFVLYYFLGSSIIGAMWFNFFAATGEFFYHSNIKTKPWMRYLIQTPELHSIHHQLDLHKYNYSDLPIWDRIFNTYKDTKTFSKQCGFPNNNEKKIGEMLIFKDVYND